MWALCVCLVAFDVASGPAFCLFLFVSVLGGLACMAYRAHFILGHMQSMVTGDNADATAPTVANFR